MSVGLATFDEMDTTSCYARQADLGAWPDGTPWEVFATLAATEDMELWTRRAEATPKRRWRAAGNRVRLRGRGGEAFAARGPGLVRRAAARVAGSRRCSPARGDRHACRLRRLPGAVGVALTFGLIIMVMSTRPDTCLARTSVPESRWPSR